MTGWYNFSNVKSSMLSFDLVAEAHGLIYLRTSGENFSFACLAVTQGGGDSNVDSEASRRLI